MFICTGKTDKRENREKNSSGSASMEQRWLAVSHLQTCEYKAEMANMCLYSIYGYRAKTYGYGTPTASLSQSSGCGTKMADSRAPHAVQLHGTVQTQVHSVVDPQGHLEESIEHPLTSGSVSTSSQARSPVPTETLNTEMSGPRQNLRHRDQEVTPSEGQGQPRDSNACIFFFQKLCFLC